MYYIYIYIYIYIYTYNIYTNLLRNVIVTLSHPRSGDSQGQKTFLAHYADKQTRNCDTQSAQTIILPNQHKVLGLSHSKIK